MHNSGPRESVTFFRGGVAWVWGAGEASRIRKEGGRGGGTFLRVSISIKQKITLVFSFCY